MFISELEFKLIDRVSDEIFNSCSSCLVDKNDVKEAKQLLKESNEQSKLEFCSAVETLYYIFSVILSEVRQVKRQIMSSLFENNPKLAQEKSVLKEKLDADEEYARFHKNEEMLFQLTEHLQNIKNNVAYMYKEENVLDN